MGDRQQFFLLEKLWPQVPQRDIRVEYDSILKRINFYILKKYFEAQSCTGGFY